MENAYLGPQRQDSSTSEQTPAWFTGLVLHVSCTSEHFGRHQQYLLYLGLAARYGLDPGPMGLAAKDHSNSLMALTDGDALHAQHSTARHPLRSGP